MQFPVHRPRRLRKNAITRNMIAETRLSKDMFIYPYFVVRGDKIKKPIPSMPGIDHFSVDTLVKDVAKLLQSGINKILLFGIEEKKDSKGSFAYNEHALIPGAIKKLKAEFGEDIYIITDVCLCSYTDHGHCGVLKGNEVLNDPTLELLAKEALAHSSAGADMVAPSDMMDGRVGAIRDALDDNDFQNTAIMSYAVKYASAYYGPFRDAANSSPGKGDRKGYQLDFRNANESLKEALLDEQEGADILMVKPALAYLDIIKTLRENTLLPVACYNVSGEYSMVKAAAKAGLIDEPLVVMENMHAFTRAGANIIITYHAKDILENKWL